MRQTHTDRKESEIQQLCVAQFNSYSGNDVMSSDVIECSK